MSRSGRSRPAPRDPVAADAFLQLVADQLIAELRSGELAPTLVHLADDGADLMRVGVKPLDEHHPTDLLLGFTAPPDWHALGIATTGWAYPLAERATAVRQRSRVYVVTLVSRTGEVAHRTHVTDDDELAAALGSAPDGPTGEQIDLLRLALGLGTEPPPCGTDVYWTIEWLSALLGTDGELACWGDVVAEHPAMALLGADAVGVSHGPAAVDPAGADFATVMGAFGRVCSWTMLRRLVRDDRFVVPDLVPSDATWLDDGAFARFVLNRCPPLTMLRSQVADLLDPALAARLAQELDQLGVPMSAWPDDHDGQAA